MDHPRNSIELLTRLTELETLLSDDPSREWDLQRQFYFGVLTLYQGQIKMAKNDPETAKRIFFLLQTDKPLTEDDAANVRDAAAIKKRISARLKELKAQGRYRPVRVKLDW